MKFDWITKAIYCPHANAIPLNPLPKCEVWGITSILVAHRLVIIFSHPLISILVGEI